MLLESGKAAKKQLEELRNQEKAEKKPLQDLAVSTNLISEKELTRLYADAIDVPYVDLQPKTISEKVLKLIPERIARQYEVVVFGINKDGEKLLAMADPDDIQAVTFLQKQLGTGLKVHIATASSIQLALDQYRGGESRDLTQVISAEADESEAEEEVSEEDLAEDSPVAQTVNLLIEYAIRAGASDIHIEPRENYITVRYRVDGILREANKLPKKVLGALVSRIKILSNLKIDERRVPQDGRFKIKIGSALYALRVSTLPISEGEKVVMRILNESSRPATLEELGYWGTSLASINRAIAQPHGMILVTGPTGSGKSTSLFSTLSLLNKPTVNISTIEDPVEYKIPGANQTQVNPKAGMTFAAGLRALLRQDPNIIMVGEIRDSETAGLGVQAALTGHLVFATLHTNNAATCLPRLLDMGIEPFLIASTVRAVVGQRLVRRLCLECRREIKPEAAQIAEIDQAFNIKSAEDRQRLHQLEQEARAAGLGAARSKSKKGTDDGLSTSDSKIVRLFAASAEGCEACSHAGYRGRIGIYEVLANSANIQKLIITGSTSDLIEQQAIREGMLPMQLDGFIKALLGQTTVEEILRVTAERGS